MPLFTPVAISSISYNSGVVTVVTSSAHGLSANQGFSQLGVTNPVFNVNNTVVGVTNSTTYTYNAALGVAVINSSGGTTQAAKEAVILKISPNTSAGTQTIQYLLWLTTVQPTKNASGSQWAGASLQENSAILVGTTVEVSRNVTYSTAVTKAQFEAAIQADFAAAQAAFAAATQPGQYYGVYFDGTGWSA